MLTSDRASAPTPGFRYDSVELGLVYGDPADPQEEDGSAANPFSKRIIFDQEKVAEKPGKLFWVVSIMAVVTTLQRTRLAIGNWETSFRKYNVVGGSIGDKSKKTILVEIITKVVANPFIIAPQNNPTYAA